MREGAHMRVVVEGLAHRFPGTDLLFEHLDFVAEPGSTIAVCGPSGCGKSTLLSILAGWEKPYAGTVTREGVNRVGWVFQNPYGVAERTALDHVVFPLFVPQVAVNNGAGQVLAAHALGLEHGADFPAGVAGVKLIHDIAEGRKIIVAFQTVHAIVDGN